GGRGGGEAGAGGATKEATATQAAVATALHPTELPFLSRPQRYDSWGGYGNWPTGWARPARVARYVARQSPARIRYGAESPTAPASAPPAAGPTSAPTPQQA